MSTSMSFVARIARAAVIGATTVGLAVGLTTAPAAAAPAAGNVYLAITKRSNGSYWVHMSGSFPMSEYDAHGYMNNLGSRGGMIYRLYGDDDGSNDQVLHTFGRIPGTSLPSPTLNYYFYATPQGIAFKHEYGVEAGKLNEDNSYIGNNYGDEVYGKAIFIDGDGREHAMYSNLVIDLF